MWVFTERCRSEKDLLQSFSKEKALLYIIICRRWGIHILDTRKATTNSAILVNCLQKGREKTENLTVEQNLEILKHQAWSTKKVVLFVLHFLLWISLLKDATDINSLRWKKKKKNRLDTYRSHILPGLLMTSHLANCYMLRKYSGEEHFLSWVFTVGWYWWHDKNSVDFFSELMQFLIGDTGYNTTQINGVSAVMCTGR